MSQSTDQAVHPAITLTFSPEMLADPYPFYHMLRSADPVHWDENLGVWIVTRYADVAACLRDARLIANRIGSFENLKETGLEEVIPIFRILSDMMLFSDPPKHTRLRGLIHKSFTPQMIEDTQTLIQEIVDMLLDRVQNVHTGWTEAGAELRGTVHHERPPNEGRKVPFHMDVIHDLAYPLPTIVIAMMLGVPLQGRDRFRKWWYDVMAFLKNAYTAPEHHQQALQSVVELTDDIRSIFTHIRENPESSLLSELATAGQDGDKLSERELLANCILLLSVGQESVTNLIGNGTLALLRNPDQLQKLKDDPTLLDGAIEEFLRYDSPVQFTGRLAVEDLVIGGKRIAKGQYVMLVLAAANRDPLQFPDPDQLNIERQRNRHVTFGYGPHFCLGAPLARLEGKIAFSAVLRRMPGLRLATDVLEWRKTFSSRGLESLPVVFC